MAPLGSPDARPACTTEPTPTRSGSPRRRSSRSLLEHVARRAALDWPRSARSPLGWQDLSARRPPGPRGRDARGRRRSPTTAGSRVVAVLSARDRRPARPGSPLGRGPRLARRSAGWANAATGSTSGTGRCSCWWWRRCPRGRATARPAGRSAASRWRSPSRRGALVPVRRTADPPERVPRRPGAFGRWSRGSPTRSSPGVWTVVLLLVGGTGTVGAIRRPRRRRDQLLVQAGQDALDAAKRRRPRRPSRRRHRETGPPTPRRRSLSAATRSPRSATPSCWRPRRPCRKFPGIYVDAAVSRSIYVAPAMIRALILEAAPPGARARAGHQRTDRPRRPRIPPPPDRAGTPMVVVNVQAPRCASGGQRGPCLPSRSTTATWNSPTGTPPSSPASAKSASDHVHFGGPRAPRLTNARCAMPCSVSPNSRRCATRAPTSPCRRPV